MSSGTVAEGQFVEEAKEAYEDDAHDEEEEEEELDFPPNWTMKSLADHATQTHSDFKHVLEFGRMGIYDFEEQEHTLEWIASTFKEIELFRWRHLRENADVESEARLDARLHELREMFEELRTYYRSRGQILLRHGEQIILKF
ncbi:hypothetical protein PMAYCL1PPCAC_30700 [Pristionchus mayeri]|uniref:Uncharacterized protein n=1 Tax=Pristionchus mayeri TaxID=1317129 RepID=A0AAN5DE94_9BILA|nr:hypothetical protein PMAYCL1PPCAC_30700 [Pristionchus mayeri]